MITAIDFGCHTIRSAFRCPDNRQQISLFNEQAEYAVLPNTTAHLQALADNLISYALCEDSLVVFGNRAADVRWLSRQPCAPLFANGNIPREDAPARQILSVLTQALLPTTKSEGICYFTCPKGESKGANQEFLSRLIRIHGWTPVCSSAASAVTLASGSDTRFTGLSLVVGAETTEICVSRFGQEIASSTIDVGSNWMDSELATQFKMHTWDEKGDCYLDLQGIRDWKHDSRVHLRTGVGERERMLSQLYGVLMNRIATSVRDLLKSKTVASTLGDERLALVCAGGASQVDGFESALTERFVEHDLVSQIQSVRIAEDPANAVVRGLLIHGELSELSESAAA